MINGAHMVIYSRDPEADRAFFQDVLNYPHVDVGGGFLIFKLPPAEITVHPHRTSLAHELYFMCDDIEATMKELTAKGIEFTEGIIDEGWALLTRLRMPGGSEVAVYQPRHERATEL
jgi:predicted enzyme related to lactoylglutathione lyase